MPRPRSKGSTKLPRRQPHRRQHTVAVIGLGYVGLPLACLASEKGWRVFGVVRDPEKVKKINAAISPIRDPVVSRWVKRVRIEATTDYAVIRRASVVVICVPTPVDKLRNPDLTPVRESCKNILPYLRRRHLIILESTVNPGVCEEVVIPILEKSGLRAGKDFSVAHCPERIDPGNRKWTVRNIPRVIGATDQRGLTRALAFYESILDAPVRPMKTIREAEAVKIFENSFRDVNIAFVNEMARSFARLGIDTKDVIDGAKTKPFGFLAHYPSAGVGGHCIPVDPYYLIERARQSGFDHRFLRLAREINNAMPAYTVELLIEALNKNHRSLSSSKVGILGLAYKANVADTRESPSFEVMRILDKYGASYRTFDPFVPERSTTPSLDELLEWSDSLVLMTDHTVFRTLEPVHVRRKGITVVIDGKNALDKDAFLRSGIIYYGIGR